MNMGSTTTFPFVILSACLIGTIFGQRVDYECPQRNGQFADSEDCHFFHQCENGVAHRQACPPGSLYDGARHECVNRHEKVKCGPQPTTEPPPSTTPDPNASTPCDVAACVRPHCFCSPSGKVIPGGLNREETPQMIMVTFDGAVNVLNSDIYNTVFTENRTNPNGCPIRGTFFVTHDYSDYSKVQTFHSKGHEIAIASVSRRVGLENEPADSWVGEMVTMREILKNFASTPTEEVVGMRAPHLRPGRNAQYEVMYDYGFIWDSSMAVPPTQIPYWPYTLDYEIPHECRSGSCPTSSFPGVWEIPMNAHFRDETYEAGFCPYLDQCGFNGYDKNDIFAWLKSDFLRHYEKNRAPYMLSLSVNWFNTKDQQDGLLMFIDYTLTLPDVYYTTMTELIQWVSDPQPLSKLSTYAAFDCKQKVLPAATCARPKSCPLVLSDKAIGVTSGGTRYMGTCERCPSTYPWIFDARGFGRVDKDVYEKVTL